MEMHENTNEPLVQTCNLSTATHYYNCVTSAVKMGGKNIAAMLYSKVSWRALRLPPRSEKQTINVNNAPCEL